LRGGKKEIQDWGQKILLDLIPKKKEGSRPYRMSATQGREGSVKEDLDGKNIWTHKGKEK